MKRPCVYMLASRPNGTLYVGVTSDVLRRVREHKTDAVPGFCATDGVHRLLHVEFHDTMENAILGEKRLKAWQRAWKIALIEKHNPDWRDLYDDLVR